MEVTSFFSRLLRPPTLSRRESEPPHVQLDDVEAFESAWTVIQVGLLHSASAYCLIADGESTGGPARAG